LKTEYDPNLLWHTHPFFHSYSAFTDSSKITSRSDSVQMSPNVVSQNYREAKFVKQYFRNYKSSLNKLKQMDIVLDRKAKGLLPQNSNFGGFTRQPLTDDFNIAGHHGYESDSKRKNQKLSPASEERRL
jgi:hypothetical protein